MPSLSSHTRESTTTHAWIRPLAAIRQERCMMPSKGPRVAVLPVRLAVRHSHRLRQPRACGVGHWYHACDVNHHNLSRDATKQTDEGVSRRVTARVLHEQVLLQYKWVDSASSASNSKSSGRPYQLSIPEIVSQIMRARLGLLWKISTFEAGPAVEDKHVPRESMWQTQLALACVDGR